MNADETGFSSDMQKKKRKVISQVGRKRTVKRTKFALDHTTAMICTNAKGETLPTYLIFKDSYPTKKTWTDGVPDDWGHSTSRSGFMNSDLFTEWIKFICKILKVMNEISFKAMDDGHPKN